MKTLNQKIFSFIFIFLLISSIFVGLNFGTDYAKASNISPCNYVLVLNTTQPGLEYLFNLTSADFNFSNLPYYYFKDDNGNYVYAWIESLGYNSSSGLYYANVWVNLTSSTSYYLIYNGNYNQYMGINPVLDYLFGLQYGQYDNGVNVFNYYWDFAGNTLPSGWVTSSSMTAIVYNGLILKSSASGQTFTYQTNLTPPLTYEIYGKVINTSTLISNLAADLNYPLLSTHNELGEGYNNGNYLLFYVIGSTVYWSNIQWNVNTFYLDGISWNGSSVYMYVNYTQIGNDTENSSYANIRIWQASSTTFIQWIRVRTYSDLTISYQFQVSSSNIQTGTSSTVNITFPYNIIINFNYTQPGLQVLVNLTSSNFNFMLLPYYAFVDNNGNYVYAWIENLGYDNSGLYYVNVWIKMTNSTNYAIKYLGSFNQYMGINPLLDNLFNLSYGQYDNGIIVFNYYQNWGNLSSLPSGWSQVSTISITFNSTYFQYKQNDVSSVYYGLYYNLSSPIAGSFFLIRTFVYSYPNGNINYFGISSQKPDSKNGSYYITNTTLSQGYNLVLLYVNSSTNSSTISYLTYVPGSISGSYVNIYYTFITLYPSKGIFPNYTFTFLYYQPQNTISQYSISLNSILNITSTLIGNWYMNNQLVLSNSTYYIFYANITGIYNIYENINGIISNTIQVIVFDPSQSLIIAQNNGDINNIVLLNGYSQYMINFTVPYNITISMISLYLGGEQLGVIDPNGHILTNYYNIPISLINTTNNQINYIYNWNVNISLAYYYNLSIPSGLYLYSGNYSILINDTSLGSLYIGYFTSQYLFNSTNYNGFIYGNTFTNSIYPYFQIMNTNTQFINITINEQGLPSGTQWYVNIQGAYLYSLSNSISFNLPYNSGFYNISFGSTNPLYAPYPSYHIFDTSLPFNITYNIEFNYVIPSPYIEFIPYISVPFNITVSWQYNPNNLPPDVLPIYNNTIVYNNNSQYANWYNGNVYIYNYSQLFYNQNLNYITSVIFIITLWNTSQNALITSYSLSNSNSLLNIQINNIIIPMNILLNNNIIINFTPAQFYNVSFIFNGFYNSPPSGTIIIKSYSSSTLSNSNTIPIEIQNTVKLYNGTYAILPNGSYSLKITLNTYDYILSYPSTFNISGSNITIIVNASVNYIPVYFYEQYLFNENIIVNISGYTFFNQFVSYSISNNTTFPYSSIGLINLTSGVYTISVYYTQNYSNYTIVNISTMGGITLINLNNITNTAQFSFITNKYYNQIIIVFNYTGYTLNIISNLPSGNNFFYNITNLNYSSYFSFYGYSNGNNLILTQLPAGYYYIYLFAGYNFLSNPELKLYIYLNSSYTLYVNFTYALYNLTINVNINTYYWALNYTVPYNLTLNIQGIDNYYQNTYINYTFTFYNLNYSGNGQYFIKVLLPIGLYNIIVNSPQFNPSVQNNSILLNSNNNINFFISPITYTVIINSNSNMFNTITITFYANNGNITFTNLQLPYNISLIPNLFYNYTAYYTLNNYYYAQGSFYLNQNPFYLNLTFNSQNGVNITLYEQGLPYSVEWNVIVIYGQYQLIYSSTNNTITFIVPQYTNVQVNILNVSIGNYNYAPNITNIQINTQNYNSLIYFITFNLYNPITNPSSTSQNNTNSISQSLNSLAVLLNIPSQAITLGLFLVIFLIFIGLVAYKTRNNIAIGITAFSLIGLGYVLNIIPLWIIVFLFSSVIAIFLYMIFLRGEGEE
jgi:hypothetical protein